MSKFQASGRVVYTGKRRELSREGIVYAVADDGTYWVFLDSEPKQLLSDVLERELQPVPTDGTVLVVNRAKRSGRLKGY